MRRIYLFTIFAVIISAMISCTNGNNELSPVIPTLGTESPNTALSVERQPQTQLWGCYEIEIDIPTQTVTAVPLRHAMFTANVTKFVNGKAANLGFKINDTPVTPEYIDVDIDVTITHPFPGLLQYNGYDVMGIFMGNGSATMQYNSDLVYSVNGTDQTMKPPPDDSYGGPDGYTRWFNAVEFSTGGMPLFQYTPGKVATPKYTPSATLCPYKYFADGLGATEDLWSWLENNPGEHGVFTSGASNTRSYYLRFPKSVGVKYAYAIIASWKGTEAADHPANAPEAIGCKVVDNSNVFYVDPTQKGGDLNFDISLWDWNSTVSAGVMEDYKIYIESTVLSSVYEVTASDMIPTGGNENYSTYHVDIPADNINGTTGNEYWIIAEDANLDYTNEFGITNLADTDPLAAFFRFDLTVSDESGCNNWVPAVDTLNGEINYNAVTKPYTGWTIEGDLFEDGTPGVAVNDGASDLVYATNVQWIDVNKLYFDIDLTGLPIGTYDMVVINGCGAKERGIGTDMLTVLKWIHTVGTPNIDVATGYGTPTEIAIDPSSDQTAVYYFNTWVKWSSDYTVHASPYSSWASQEMGPGDTQATFMWYAHVYYGYSTYLCWTWTDWNGGNTYPSYWQPFTGDRMIDIANVQGNIRMWGAYDWKGASGGPYFCFMPSDGIGNFNYFFGGAPFYNGSGSTGVMVDNVRAIDLAQDSGSNSPDMYILEYLPSTPSGVVEKWQVGSPPTYKSAFGENFFYNPLDITVDSSYNVYVLEENSGGAPVIWAYNSSGVLVGTSEPLTASEISGDPLRIDASLSKNPDEVHVIHSLGVTRFAM
ncbi:MAG: hypothetical protein ABIC40_05910 [bacterium]